MRPKLKARALHCWFRVDRVNGDADTTAWKRLARLRQARWRAALDLVERYF